uniref:Uncharacterized protein n=1 Tax=Oryza sativa subsp. japonica TaxID=39947 RepID=Q6EQN3_ORYSJ|nr:hypothetical protein [Oryza sativa Japonica Group]BAD29037.1 hypothetical protein [Oryza sativa Japonica Group]
MSATQKKIKNGWAHVGPHMSFLLPSRLSLFFLIAPSSGASRAASQPHSRHRYRRRPSPCRLFHLPPRFPASAPRRVTTPVSPDSTPPPLPRVVA